MPWPGSRRIIRACARFVRRWMWRQPTVWRGGDAAGFDRLRAEREVLDIEADHALAASERARAQATVASSFADTIDPSRVVAVPRQPTPASIPTVDALVERAEAARGDLLALRKEVDAAQFSAKAADRRWVPEPEIVAGTKS